MRKPTAAGKRPAFWTSIPRDHRMLYLLMAVAGLLLLLTLLLFFAVRGGEDDPGEVDLPVFGDLFGQDEETESDGNGASEDVRAPYATKSPRESYLSHSTAATERVKGSLLAAGYAILVRGDTLESLAEKDADTVIYPASLTKIMTLATAMDLITDLDAKVAITKKQVDFAYTEGAKTVGFEVGEEVTVRDLLYAVSLESCAVSAIALAEELAGSEKAFVQKMNEKARELGLKDTHFTNTIGLHHDEHYTTARELAAIFAYAMDNELCRTILTAYSYRAVTNVHQNGITSYSTLLRDRFADKNVDTKLKSGHEVLGGKTGYTAKAAYCLATYSEDADGVPYLLITCGGNSSVSTVDDCIVMLQNYGTTAS